MPTWKQKIKYFFPLTIRLKVRKRGYGFLHFYEFFSRDL
jgi:hypothetical protein